MTLLLVSWGTLEHLSLLRRRIMAYLKESVPHVVWSRSLNARLLPISVSHIYNGFRSQLCAFHRVIVWLWRDDAWIAVKGKMWSVTHDDSDFILLKLPSPSKVSWILTCDSPQCFVFRVLNVRGQSWTLKGRRRTMKAGMTQSGPQDASLTSQECLGQGGRLGTCHLQRMSLSLQTRSG